ncbi:hypothetical protein [Amycolatopsis sp. NPDC051061]|uniref:aromatic-ring hydroxylase C-terminal domain-containing protein n=1 Tax=Amycolatopsis sp. NPDC051061 TaxID=3155042 RepID=UPI003436702F
MAQLRAVQYHLDDVLSGMGIRYPMPGAGDQPLVGRPAPDQDLGRVRSHELLRRGCGVLLDPADEFAEVGARWQDRVHRAGQGAGTEPMLIRPDGYVLRRPPGRPRTRARPLVRRAALTSSACSKRRVDTAS